MRGPENTKIFRLAYCAAFLALFCGYVSYRYSMRHLTPPAASVSASDELFDPVTGVNRMFCPTPADDRSREAGIQSRTHHVILVVSFVIVVGCILQRLIVPSTPSGRFDRLINIAFWASLAASAALLLYIQRASPFKASVGVGLSACLYFIAGRFCTSRRNRIIGLLGIILIALWYGPGLMVKVDLSTDAWWQNELAEKHLVLTISQGDRLAQGLPLYEQIFPSYGGILAIVKAAAVRLFGPTSARTDVVWVEAVHLIFVSLSAWCFYLYSGRRALLAVLALVFLASTNSFATWIFYHAPNHTAWRTIFYPIALLGVLYSARLSFRREALTLGLIGMFALLQNFETGTAITAGLSWYLFCKHGLAARRWKAVATLQSAVWFAIGACAAIIVHAGTCVVVLGYAPNYAALVKQIGQLMRVVTTGHGGGPFLELDPLALVILAHAVCVFVAGTLRSLDDRSTIHRGELRIAASVMILVWFSYYFNRPDRFYLSSFYVAYGVLLIDLLRVIAAARRGSPALIPAAVVAAFALSVVVVPASADAFATRWSEYRIGMRRLLTVEPPPKSVLISGWRLPDDALAHDLFKRADFIREVAREHGSVVYLTENCYFIPKLSGIWSDLPVAEPFWESPNSFRFEQLTRSIIDSDHREIYFDAPLAAGSAAAPNPSFNSSRFYGYLKKALANDFEFVESVSGWERWRRR